MQLHDILTKITSQLLVTPSILLSFLQQLGFDDSYLPLLIEYLKDQDFQVIPTNTDPQQHHPKLVENKRKIYLHEQLSSFPADFSKENPSAILSHFSAVVIMVDALGHALYSPLQAELSTQIPNDDPGFALQRAFFGGVVTALTQGPRKFVALFLFENGRYKNIPFQELLQRTTTGTYLDTFLPVNGVSKLHVSIGAKMLESIEESYICSMPELNGTAYSIYDRFLSSEETVLRLPTQPHKGCLNHPRPIGVRIMEKVGGSVVLYDFKTERNRKWEEDSRQEIENREIQ
jgi:hypothetical protein